MKRFNFQRDRPTRPLITRIRHPSQPAHSLPTGALHPLTQIRDEAIQILRRMGFALADGPEIEDEYHCFDALNTPEDHTARNEKDTFYFNSEKLLRTHTSSVRVRTMETATPPIQIIASGSAYRRSNPTPAASAAQKQIPISNNSPSVCGLKISLSFLSILGSMENHKFILVGNLLLTLGHFWPVRFRRLL